MAESGIQYIGISLTKLGTRAKYVILRSKNSYCHGCHGYQGNSCHCKKKNRVHFKAVDLYNASISLTMWLQAL